MKARDLVPWLYLLSCAVVLAIGWWAFSAVEARAFERLTGKPVSTTDAMFLDLRIQEPISPEALWHR